MWGWMYKNREEAAEKLAGLLINHKDKDGVVLGIPRGGIPLAYQIATELHFELDVAMIKKIGHPLNPELAIGAVSINDRILSQGVEVSKEYLDKETEQLQEQLKQNYRKFTNKDSPDYNLKNKVVILADDGIATGSTMLATVELLKHEEPQKLIIAVPVAPPYTVDRFKEIVDEVVCPLQPKNFQAVGQFYQVFNQTADEEVIELLERFKK